MMSKSPAPAASAVTTEGETFSSAPKRLQYVEIDPPPPGGSVVVAPGVRWARIPLPMDLNHINVWLVETDGGCIVVDTGMAVDIGREAWESIERETFASLPLRAIFVTHIHPDHIGLASWLQQRHGVPVLMSRRTHELAKILAGGPGAPSAADAEGFVRSHGVADMEQIRPMLRPERFGRVTSGLPDVEKHVADGETLRWGTHDWTALETNGHAEGHLCLSNDARRILISGDQVLPTISPNISYTYRTWDENPLGSYLASLERLSSLHGDTLVLPSHGRPFHGLHHRLDDLRSRHEQQLDMLVGACAVPKCGGEVLPLMFRRELKGFHLFLALGEALAHLEYLVHAGRLARSTVDGIVRYAA
jgi:glyoxylase-like metal-dependent hydrolase (beta-lactamase superfamily II)